MLTCKEASKLVSRELDAKLEFADRAKLRFHLMMCSACSNFQKQVGALQRACRHVFVPYEKGDRPDEGDHH